MIQSFYSAKTALINKQQGLNAIANNISNVNTNGFKKSDTTFGEALYYEVARLESNYQVGSGTYLSKVEKNFAQGDVVETGNQLDLALDGKGFIGVMGENSTICYTRGGSFSFSASSNEQVKRLVNEAGYPLVDQNGDYIELPANVNSFFIDRSGRISYEGQQQQQLMLVDFPAAGHLQALNNGVYLETELSGEPFTAEDVTFKQGYLEHSNVEVADELVDLIQTQRMFQMNAKVLQAVDEMESQSNKLRK